MSGSRSGVLSQYEDMVWALLKSNPGRTAHEVAEECEMRPDEVARVLRRLKRRRWALRTRKGRFVTWFAQAPLPDDGEVAG